MRLTRARSFMAAGVVAATSLATVAVLIAGPASAKPAAPASSRPVVLVNPCNTNQGLVKPSTYDNGCMPSQEFVSGLSWTSWTSTAFGSGTLKVNNCNPSCAMGRYIKFPILVVLWRSQPWPHHAGRKYFSRLTWIFTGKRPSGVHTAAQTFTLPS
ncbi:MAG TPA: hypothetical protein VN695_10825 [Streptosporangiaceae bacterium]|nr:hypothetical protein [Streptosporangiaceae bacterium]